MYNLYTIVMAKQKYMGNLNKMNCKIQKQSSIKII